MESIKNNCLKRFDMEYSSDTVNILKTYIYFLGSDVKQEFIVMLRIIELYDAIAHKNSIHDRQNHINEKSKPEKSFDRNEFMEACMENVSKEKGKSIQNVSRMFSQYEQIKDMLELVSVMKEVFPNEQESSLSSDDIKSDESKNNSDFLFELLSAQMDEEKASLIQNMMSFLK